MGMGTENDDGRLRSGHVLLVPWPGQGHINPMLQFAKRLASHGPLATLAVTRSVLTTPADGEPTSSCNVSFAVISDGFDDGGLAKASSLSAYIDGLKSVGSETLSGLIEAQRAEGRPVDIIVYDTFLPWALQVAKHHGVAAAAFFTQSFAVNAVYHHLIHGRLTVPLEDGGGGVKLPGLPPLKQADFPSILMDPATADPSIMPLLQSQYDKLEEADVVLVNSFYELEREEADWMESTTSMKPIGPTVPSSYLDNRLPTDTRYGFNLFTPTIGPCMTWLDSKPTGSVVYVSFGSMVCLSEEQMCELAGALRDCDKSFLWVVRATETIKLPHGFFDHQPLDDRGLVIPWGPQLEVLAHAAVGCFVTHCGWNSTIEGLCLGVPMIGVPQWSDQQTNAKYVEDVWRVGVRARADERGVVKRGEFLKCIGDVTGGKKGEETRENARKWREMAKAAVSEGGSSDKNILEFIEKFC